jgi:hypothetical protein
VILKTGSKNQSNQGGVFCLSYLGCLRK